MPTSNIALSPACFISLSSSFFTFSTVSSMRAGCILPSAISFSSASLATSLLMGSNPERMTTSGVSSIMNSMPVAFSSARIFLPSLPMILAFMSSLGSDTVDTVTSDVWSAAQRCMARVIIFFASFVASSLAVCSMFLTCSATSWRVSSRISLVSSVFASSLVSCATFSSS